MCAHSLLHCSAASWASHSGALYARALVLVCALYALGLDKTAIKDDIYGKMAGSNAVFVFSALNTWPTSMSQRESERVRERGRKEGGKEGGIEGGKE